MRRSKKEEGLASDLARLPHLGRDELCDLWRSHYGSEPIANLSRSLLILAIGYKMQETVRGGLPASLQLFLRDTATGVRPPLQTPTMKPGTVLIREWHGTTHEVTVLEKGYLYRDKTHRSLTGLARTITGMHRSGPEFFGLRSHAN